METDVCSAGRYLYLNYNEIKFLHSSTFQGLSSLRCVPAALCSLRARGMQAGSWEPSGCRQKWVCVRVEVMVMWRSGSRFVMIAPGLVCWFLHRLPPIPW